MADFTIKQHDTYPPIEARLQDVNGPIDLSTASQVKLLMYSSTHLVSGACAITDAVNGRVRYVWMVADTAFAGDYKAEWEITWAGGQVETVPNDGYKAVTIYADLG